MVATDRPKTLLGHEDKMQTNIQPMPTARWGINTINPH